MRILSQDGRIDVPYENFSLSITQDNCIVATRDVAASMEEILIGVVAKYSTEEKAKKAVEMLHEAYQAHFMYETMTTEQKALFLTTTSEKEREYICGVFRFQNDAEIEV